MNSTENSQAPTTASPTSFRLRRLPLMRRAFGTAVAVTLLVATHAAMLSAQHDPKPPIGAHGVSLIQTRPVGTLGNNIGSGYGLAGALFFPWTEPAC